MSDATGQQTSRKNPPPRERIAAYWREEGRARSGLLAARASLPPACFACQHTSRGWKTWNQAKLERAHIIARGDGGSIEPSNFVLLCAECHEEAPMVLDPRAMIAFCAEREQSDWRRARLAIEQLKAAGYTGDDFDLVTKERLMAALTQLGAGLHLGRHGAKMSASTMAAASRHVIETVKAAALLP